MFITIMEAAVIALVLSVDAFAAAVAYGCKKIEIPWESVLVITIICTGIVGISFFAGAFFSGHISAEVASLISFIILFLIGTAKLLDYATKELIRRYSNISKEIKLSIFNFKFVLYLYANPEAADVDVSKSISKKEAAVLALSLSLDGVAVGFGAALLGINGWAVVLFSLFTNGIGLKLGSKLGCKVAENLQFNISWVSGAILIGLAFMRL
jgi:putative sporulation protein YtaF